ncbi:thiamine-phosphate kinase [Cohaesibacter celericrescens]|uniref:thiamine-phosphate kinase n=1 Tax=Cohaesibacter celericrescens TaxID=2067669 RepID=UPI003569EB7F
MAKSNSRRGESALIAHYFAPLCDPDASFGLTDDAAFLTVPDGQQLVLTKDMLVADVHFFANDRPELIARKALRVNLSDLAAKGASPLGYMLGLGLPADWSEDWLSAFCEGLKQDQGEFSFPLIGGDTVKTAERLTLSITALGTVKAGKPILRRNAQPGDDVYVSGTIGDGALGLLARRGTLNKLTTSKQSDYLVDRFLLPRPRTDLSPLICHFASASMDISDGLLGDAAKMAMAAGVSITLMLKDIPLSDAGNMLVQRQPNLMHTALSGGDDYELLFCAPRMHREAIMQTAQTFKTPITCVGAVEVGEGVNLFDRENNCLVAGQNGAYEHF